MTTKTNSKEIREMKAKRGLRADPLTAKVAEHLAKAEASTKVPKQLNIPGTAPKVHKDVEEAVEALQLAKEVAKGAAKKRERCEGEVLLAMRKHQIRSYAAGSRSFEVLIEGNEKVKIRPLKRPSARRAHRP